MGITIDRGPRPGLVVLAIQHYHPDWEAPDDDRPGEWIKVRCPFHDDSKASAGINYEMDAFSCMACGAKGNYWTLILQQEGSYAKANAIAEGLAEGRNRPVPPSPSRQPSRRVFGQPGAARPSDSGADRPVSSGIRGRATPWT